ncbi:pectate lyase [Phocaeicola coprocola]|uniref:pectate lyase n=1 Tax=Phocaeicola coprocola TaxID=310298 RepID=UPI001C3824F5|nr:pectate lyase [Phocaeicola coprocola]MBV3865717.1 pectate lyase [Phocaeicola coprocola]MBV4007846.1 pectate lyase [Phocaeicola coprocola]MBV4031323.1 pectate lyase [Phocaeicola coprocola]MBV4037918.1 pectate lyase [Phocaeicola coprocola]MBV4059549.1 pectate lyase [Phocaeicola coprocola]
MRLKKYLFLLCIPMSGWAQQVPSTMLLQDGIHHWNLLHPNRSYMRYAEIDYEKIADNLIAYQNLDGGWLKNIDWLGVLNSDSVKATLNDFEKQSTLDNRNTFSQIEYLADTYVLTNKLKYRLAVEKGLDYLLDTQKENGGWRGWDVDAVTFNDDVTTGALELCRNILQGDKSFLWLDQKYLDKIKIAYTRGINLILKTQYIQNGVKTVWAQQYDNVTLEPVKARSFELPGLTAWESSNIVLLLMGIENPSNEIIQAVHDAVNWFKKSAINGIRIQQIALNKDKIINQEYPYDNVVVEDVNAKPIWTRYYELSDNKPFMVKRSGEKVWKLADVNAERRTGYDWYGYWPQEVLDNYPKWLKKINRNIDY